MTVTFDRERWRWTAVQGLCRGEGATYLDAVASLKSAQKSGFVIRWTDHPFLTDSDFRRIAGTLRSTVRVK